MTVTSNFDLGQARETVRPGDTPWLVRLSALPHRASRLVCFPYAGGAANVFRSWRTALPSGVELWAVELPGRSTRLREAPVSDLDRVVDALEPHAAALSDVPLALFGHSLGALVAFELTRRLSARSVAVRALIVSGCRPPHLPKRVLGLHSLPRPALVAALRRLEGTPEAVLLDEQLLQLVEPSLRADMRMHDTYVYRPSLPLDVPIHAVGGGSDPLVTPEEMDAWAAQTRRFGGVRLFPGRHFYLRDSEQDLLSWLGGPLGF